MGIAVAVAFIRGSHRHSTKELGNFWVDLTRSIVWILLPLSIVGGLVLVSQGVVQNLDAPTRAVTVQGAVQTIAQGPFASQEIIKELGTNGGGSYNANSAHPYENPTPRQQPAGDAGHPRHPRRRSPTRSGASPGTSGRAGRSSPPRACCW